MSRTIAINVALLPDAETRARAIALNRRLRENYPAGFALGEDRLVHITLAQAFVAEKNLDAIWREVEKISLEGKLQVQKFDFFPRGDGSGSSGWDLNRPPWLLAAQQKVADLLKPFIETGDREAFFRKPGEAEIPESTLNYVEQFFSAHSGDHYNPHITLGRAHQDFLYALRAEPFEPFDVALEQLGIFQLGSHGTCRKILRTMDLQQK